MTDPFEVLGLTTGADDDEIRQRYLDLVRQFPPERSPEKFAEVKQAYDRLRDLDTRLRYRLFEAGKKENLHSLIEEISCRNSRRRIALETLLSMTRKP